ncbi:MAG: tetratricopeptide repeat protein [Treponema sp.]|nr:tetratricopeptide repeat protein [Treponema sp.]MCL2271376.1 tetratricopeptide repeat protein [Treponema sp.]
MKNFLRLMFLLLPVLVITGCTSAAISAEEYYSIGMAYFELGKYEEAERWLSRAKSTNRTMIASQYNLGRLAFERQRYNEAAGYFEDILKRDHNNILALRAAAYTRIKTGEIDIAQKHYQKLLELVPENADDGYNHALVLYAMGRYSGAEEILEKYRTSLLEKSEVRLLYARVQDAQNKTEAINSYSLWLSGNTDAKVRYEYGQALERNEYYARAAAEYRKALTETSNRELTGIIRFALGAVLLVADRNSSEGITEVREAVNGGFNDLEAAEKLLTRQGISPANIEIIRGIINDMKLAAETDN